MQIRFGIGKQCTDARQITRVQIDYTEVRQTRFAEYHSGNYQNLTGNQSAERVRENMPEHYPCVARAERSCRQNILLILKSIKLHSCSSRHTYPARQEERYEQNQQMSVLLHCRVFHMQFQYSNDDHERHRA